MRKILNKEAKKLASFFCPKLVTGDQFYGTQLLDSSVMIPETVGYIVPVITKSIPNDIGDYIALDDSLPCGLRWIKQASRTGPRVIGKPAGCFNGRGYYQFYFRGKLYQSHRVIYYLLTGEDPGDMFIDHHKDQSNNGTNLRPATNQQNQMNKISRPNSSSKYKGVVWHKPNKKWRAQITLNGKNKTLGYYLNEEDAAYAYNIAASIVFGEYCKLNKLPPEYNTNLFEHRDKVIKKAKELLANS